MGSKPWAVPDGLVERIEPLLPRRRRRFRYPGRKPFDDLLALQGSCSSCIRGSVGNISRKSWGLVAG
jgi:hypothetical protein